MAWYASLPQNIDVVAFSIGEAPVYWYGVMWILALVTTIVVALGMQRYYRSTVTITTILDACFWGFFGALLGGRLGYVLFYQFAHYREDPLSIVLPYNTATETWTGLAGFSYHGGVVGVVLALFIFAHQRGINFFTITDFLVPGVALGYTWGRIGNFLNSELYGRPTDSALGMYFGEESILRHPSQLYEAFAEGMFLGIVCIVLFPRVSHRPGVLSGLYILGYGLIRFFVEFTRMPDVHLGLLWGGLSMGQWLSVAMMVVGSSVVYWRMHSKGAS